MTKLIIPLLFISSISFGQITRTAKSVTIAEIHSSNTDELKNQSINQVDYEFILSRDLKTLTIIDKQFGTSTVLDFQFEEKQGDDNYQVFKLKGSGGIVKFCFKLLIEKTITMITYPSFDQFRYSVFVIE